MNPTLKKTITRTFIQLLSDLKTEKQITTFLTDFFSGEEFETYTRRLAIVYWLKKGRDYNNIQNNLKASLKEIKEVEKSLSSQGLKLALKYLEADEWANIWSERIKKVVK